MQFKTLAIVSALAGVLAGCGGDVNINPQNAIDNSVGDNSNNTTNQGGGGPDCATYEKGGQTFTGSLVGDNCIYSTAFVDFDNPLTVDVSIPAIDGAHIFQGSLWVGANYDSDADLAAAGINEGGDGPTLTVAAGSTIALRTSADFMVVNRGSQIVAQGTAEAPITFTSESDVIGVIDPEAIGEWGGMVINGFGVTNACTYTGTYGVDLALAGECHVPSEGSEGEQANNYGGNNDDDNSGILEYVIVKHTGAEVGNGDELNGITFAGVGRGTTVSHIQAYSTLDDGIEMFGGAVNVDHYVALYVNDDSLDFDESYRGSVEYALVVQGEETGNHCIEADGLSSSADDTPDAHVTQDLQSQPLVKNLTCILSSPVGPKDQGKGFEFKQVFGGAVQNAIVVNAHQADDASVNACFNMPDQITVDRSNLITLESVVFACIELTAGGGTSTAADQLAFVEGQTGIIAYAANAAGEDPSTQVSNGLELLNTFYSVALADMLVPGGADPATITPVDGETFIGAVTSDDDWTAGWTYGLHADNRGMALWFNPAF